MNSTRHNDGANQHLNAVSGYITSYTTDCSAPNARRISQKSGSPTTMENGFTSINVLWHYQSPVIKKVYVTWPLFNNDLLSKRSMLATALVNDLALNFAPGHTIQQEICDDAKFHGNASRYSG